MKTYRIPFNKPSLAGNELDWIKEAVLSGHISGDGKFTQKCQTLIQEELYVCKVLLTTSCTHALEIAAILLNLGPEDEVIMPSFTFVSTANAFALRGVKIVFADIRPDTLNLDEKLLPSLITSRTKAIVPVHYGGVGCEMDAICSLAEAHEIAVIEDNAHGLFGKYKGKSLGSFGVMAAQSFHETKNFSCGEGGALLINKMEYFQRAEIIREKGTNRSRFFRGEVDKYTWVDIGSSYLPSDVLAAFLYAQLEARDSIQAKRQKIWKTYQNELRPWAEKQAVGIPHVPDYCEQPYHLYYLILPSLEARNSLIRHLKEQSILSTFHYMPLHLSDMGKKYGYSSGDLPVTETISDRLLRLPFYNDLTEDEQASVIEAILAWKL